MEAGTSTAPKPAPPTDIFDRFGDFIGDRIRDGARRLVDHATVSNPLVAAGRGIADPKGTKESYARVGKEALDAISILNPAVGITRAVLATDAGRTAAAEGAKGAVEAATLASPIFAAGRFVGDPEGTTKTFERAGKVVKDVAESPLTSYGIAKRGYEWAKENPDKARKVAEVGLDIATITNPVVAMGRGIASIFGD